jgi:HK97 family phage major capsid protein
VVKVFETYAIVEIGMDHFKVLYTTAAGVITIAPRTEWQPVRQAWLDEEPQVAMGSEIKSISLSADGRYATVGGHLVLYGSPSKKDLVGDYFVPETYYGPGDGDGRDTMLHHGAAIKTGNQQLDTELASMAKTLLPPMKTRRDALGLVAEVMLDLSDAYQKMVYDLSKKGALMWSSGTAAHMIVREDDGKITQWPIVEGSFTPTPMEPRMKDHRVMPLKALLDIPYRLDGNSGGEEAAHIGAPADRTPAGDARKNLPVNFKTKKGVKAMNSLLESIKILVPGLSEEQLQGIAAVLSLSGTTSEPEKPKTEPPAEGEGNPPPIRSVDLPALAAQLKALGFQVIDPAPARPAAVTRPVYAGNPEPAANGQKALNALYMTRFTGGEDEPESTKAIMSEVIGTDYRQMIHQQNIAFTKYLRGGERYLDREDIKILNRQIFPLKSITQMITDGMEINAVKTTMIEAQGDLGGFAIPPNLQAEISARLPGMTAVRSGGGRVVTLSQGNSIEIPQYDGGDDRYRGNLRGQWGSETQTPTEQNAKLKMITVVANVYTYKVIMSQSLIEDAQNLASLVNADIIDTLGIDEDEVFLVGDGVGKPLGILPGGSNSLSLKEVVSVSASTLTAAGIKALKRGIASQYRNRGTWVGNSDTFGVIEGLNNTGVFYFEDISDKGELLGRKVFESEAMSDIAGSAYPLLFGDMSGYTIVERLGMAIERFHDSNTGINQTEFHVRRRVGGRVEKSWLFAVQKVAAS